MWQASKFIIGWALKLQVHIPVSAQPHHLWQRWLLDRLARTVDSVADGLENNDFHVVAKVLKNFFHHDFCDVYVVSVCKVQVEKRI
jgi:valyl-tRNA synthetase